MHFLLRLCLQSFKKAFLKTEWFVSQLNYSVFLSISVSFLQRCQFSKSIILWILFQWMIPGYSTHHLWANIIFFLKTKQGKTVSIFCILYLMHIFFVTPSCWVKEMSSMGNYEQGLFFSFNQLFLWFRHYLLASMQRMKFLITFSRCWINIMPFWQGNLEKLIVINLPFYLFTYLFVCLFIHLFCFLTTASPPCPSPTSSLPPLHRLLLHFFGGADLLWISINRGIKSCSETKSLALY